MLRTAGLSKQSRRLVGRVCGNGASAAAAAGNEDCNNGIGKGAAAPQGRRWQQSLLQVSATQQQSRNYWRSASCSSSGGGGGGLGGNGSVAVGRGSNLSAGWRGVTTAVAAGASVGARRGLAGRGGGSGSSSGSSAGNGGVSDTGGAAVDGDSWTPPPDAWRPDEAPTADPQEFSNMSGFDIGDGFTNSSAAADAAAVAPDVGAAVTATGLSAADLTTYPHHLFMQVIEYVQASAGVPYWEAIIMVSIATRIAVLPAVTTFLGISKRLNMVKPQMAVHQEKMQDIKLRMEANPEIKEAAMQEMMLVSQEMGTLLKSNKIHFPKMFLSMFTQFPVFISLFLATRDMGSYFPGYQTGGMDWMLNLSAPDPTWTLPILTSASMMLLMELGSDMPVAPGGEQPRFNPKHIFRAMGIVFVPVAFTMPSGVLIYWTTTNIFGMLQRGLFELRPVQQALGWPMPEDMPQAKPQTPGQDPTDTDFASKEDLERWGGGGGGGGASSDASRGATEAAERAREAVAKASKARHEELKREQEERSGGDRRQ